MSLNNSFGQLRHVRLLHFRNVLKTQLGKKFECCNLTNNRFTLFPNLSFPNLSEMKQTDVPLDSFFLWVRQYISKFSSFLGDKIWPELSKKIWVRWENSPELGQNLDLSKVGNTQKNPWIHYTKCQLNSNWQGFA